MAPGAVEKPGAERKNQAGRWLRPTTRAEAGCGWQGRPQHVDGLARTVVSRQ